jgi:hypothetical protein
MQARIRAIRDRSRRRDVLSRNGAGIGLRGILVRDQLADGRPDPLALLALPRWSPE